MPVMLLSILLFISSCFAGLEKISVQKLNMDYIFPHGKGEVEKLNINLSLVEQSYPVEMERVEDTYVLRTPMVDFTWQKPWPIAKNVEKLLLQNFSGSLGGNTHGLNADHVTYRPKNDGDYKFEQIKAKCQGKSKEIRIENRMLDDCRQHLELTIDRVEVPFNMFWAQLVSMLPKQDESLETPLKDFYLGAKDGEFYLYFIAKYIVTAGLRTWGTVHYENNFRTIVIKVNLIKFGILPVTNVVMKALKDQIKNPSIKVEPPYIRINL